MAERLWEPSPERVRRTQLLRFLELVRRRHGIEASDYASLHDWSIHHLPEFWADVWDFCEVRFVQEYDQVVDDPERMPGARWFRGARLNFAENLLRHHDEREALVFKGEDRPPVRMRYSDLWARVARLARALRASGVEPGNRVAGFLPNLPEAVVAMLATASLGAVWTSCSPDFGVSGVLDRFGQIDPRVVFTADGYRYGGKPYDSLGIVQKIRSALPSLETIVVVPYLDPFPDLGRLPGAILFEEFLGPDDSPELSFEPLPFDHPLYILYSSGTTGVPKCIVHGAGGTLLQHLKEHVLHTDLGREDRIVYFTTTGWMMWNWLVSALATGATVILYEGSPFHPTPSALFDLAESERVTVFGTSAKFLSAAAKAGFRPRETHDLSALRTVLSTGSPLSVEGFDYVYRDIKEDVCLSSISGGTDILSCFALGNPIGPVYAGELQCRGLGMAVEAWDENGRSLVGERGELVCTRAFPSMPVAFWNDPDGRRYREAYFERFPGVWHHGDYVEITPRGGVIVYGRSDATLNPGGVRIGTAEIYRQVETLPEIADSIVVGQEWEGDVRVVLFVKLDPGVELHEALVDKIRRRIRERTTPRHVPAVIAAVPDIPYTRSGKKVELAVRDVIHGREIRNREALANPEALEYFSNRGELAS
ncbi:MAG: acetoacetate--CoA ligase [Myxococcota bacterium]